MTKPAPGLAGRPQQVVGRHWFAGWETIGAELLNTAGSVAAVLGGTVILMGFMQAYAARQTARDEQSLPHP